MPKLTFLSFVEYRRARMVMAFLLRVTVHLPTRLVNTFLRHVELGRSETKVTGR